jgi:hypothetical protein
MKLYYGTFMLEMIDTGVTPGITNTSQMPASNTPRELLPEGAVHCTCFILKLNESIKLTGFV